MYKGIVEIDVHNMNQFQAKTLINSTIKKNYKNAYIIRIIHGYRSGKILRDMIRKEYKNHPQVLRIELSMNPGVTELILKTII